MEIALLYFHFYKQNSKAQVLLKVVGWSSPNALYSIFPTMWGQFAVMLLFSYYF